MSKFVTETGIERLIGIVKSELDGKSGTGHTHEIADVNGLQNRVPWESVSVLTQAEYDAITTPVSTTLYLIKEA